MPIPISEFNITSSSYLLGLFVYLFILFSYVCMYVLVPEPQDLYSLTWKCIKSVFYTTVNYYCPFASQSSDSSPGWSLDTEENIYSPFFLTRYVLMALISKSFVFLLIFFQSDYISLCSSFFPCKINIVTCLTALT